MTQPPYRPSDDHATRRLAIFIAVFLVVVAIGAQTPPRHSDSSESVCHCLPSKAALMMKSAFAKAQAHSTALATLTQN
ncbi:hypothetical protein RBB77_02465 [Tunturibacter psychrotolerans]|uniref:Uncharacterized protein n=1 Tax=Tunturiibacter psychrotolerans TaxID=3069686 RepID=A0AAU7ZS57_9BACT